ncbi:MAG: SpoVG family protein [Phycisphaerae bacterium]|nr:SpoVG family protein [Phycisphaerae bacterium]
MQVSEVRIKIVDNNNDRLKAFCSLTLDDMFVVRDLKIIEGANGLFVAMPSRKLTDHCPSCRAKNHIRSKFCNDCGYRLNAIHPDCDSQRIKLHADIAHPINAECRQIIQNAILTAYDDEYDKSQQPGYIAPNFDFEDASNEYAHHFDPDPHTNNCPETIRSEASNIIERHPRHEKDAAPKLDRNKFSEGIL